MKQAMIDYIQNEKNDERYTPVEAIMPIMKYLDKDLIYWECTDFGGSNITKFLRENGFKVIGTKKEELDFLNDEPKFEFDAIITNPPYSLKNQFLQKCYEYKKPFAMLLPITTLEGKTRGKMYQDNGLELLVLNKRINFIPEKRNVWFNTSWFCWNILPQDLIFGEVKDEQ